VRGEKRGQKTDDSEFLLIGVVICSVIINGGRIKLLASLYKIKSGRSGRRRIQKNGGRRIFDDSTPSPSPPFICSHIHPLDLTLSNLDLSYPPFSFAFLFAESPHGVVKNSLLEIYLSSHSMRHSLTVRYDACTGNDRRKL